MWTRGWTARDLPFLEGKIAVVTGGNSGIGFEAARALAERGAQVWLGCRDLGRGNATARAILDETPDAHVAVRELDLADLRSVRAFAEGYLREQARLDLLINNAGVMALPYQRTAEGFDLQFGTNHIGHFALTGLLQDRWSRTAGARVVTVSSLMHHLGLLPAEHMGDLLRNPRRYERWAAYGRSKLANLLFSFELQRRLKRAESPAIAVACHPGYAATHLQTAGFRAEGAAWLAMVFNLTNLWFAQSARAGALPTLYAAAEASVRGGDYIGPDGPFETRGAPTRVTASSRARDPETAARLWELSETATGVHFDLPGTDEA